MPGLQQSRRELLSRAENLQAAIELWMQRYRVIMLREVSDQLRDGTPLTALLMQSQTKIHKADTRQDMDRELLEILTRYGLRYANETGRKAAESVGNDQWELTPKFVSDYARTKEVQVQIIGDETRKLIRDSLQNLFANAMNETPRPGVGSLVRRIKLLWESGEPDPGAEYSRSPVFSRARAELIARTELVQIQGEAKSEAYKQSGVKLVRWLSYSGLFAGGRGHDKLNKKTSPLGTPFILPDGTPIRWPGDALAPIKHTANCRCDIAPVVNARDIRDAFAGKRRRREFEGTL